MDLIKVDGWLKSILVGRIMGGLLLIGALVAQKYGYDVTSEDQKAIMDLVTGLLAGVGGLLLLISKLREKINGIFSKKVKTE